VQTFLNSYKDAMSKGNGIITIDTFSSYSYTVEGLVISGSDYTMTAEPWNSSEYGVYPYITKKIYKLGN